MRRRVVLVLALVILILGLPRVGESPVAEVSPSGSPPPSEASGSPIRLAAVRVEHELIQVPATTSHWRARPTPAVRHARVEPRPDQPKLAGRARRVLFGDGTFRPEPFPRPTRD